MSLRFLENWSIYGTTIATMLNGIWAQNTTAVTSGPSGGLITDPDPTSSGNVFAMVYDGSNQDDPVLRYVLQEDAQDTVGIAQRVYLYALPAAVNQIYMIASWKDATNTFIAGVGVDNTGRLYVTTTQNGDQTTAVAATDTPVIGTDAWYHIECALLYGGSGTVNIRVEGSSVLSYSGSITTANGPIYQVEWRIHESNIEDTPTYAIKDVMIWDGQGSLNNTFMGPCIVYSMTPASDQALNWTPVGGANGYSILDNVPYNNSEYIEAGATPPSAYEATLTALPTTVTTVKGAMTVVRGAKSDAGTGSLQVSMVSGADTATGVDRAITTAQTYWYDIQETDPATSVAWTRTGIDAAYLKIDRTA